MNEAINATLVRIYYDNTIDVLSQNEGSETNNTRIRFFENESVFEKIFYPWIAQMDEGQLHALVGRLKEKQKEILLSIPENYTRLSIMDITELNDNNVLELRCREPIVKAYKYQQFFTLLSFIVVDKTYSLEKENHKYGYHFHLYERAERTATLLTFNPKEKPNKIQDKKYSETTHTLYYEPHAEGATSTATVNVNAKTKKFKTILYDKCRAILNKINKIDFKIPSTTKATQLAVV